MIPEDHKTAVISNGLHFMRSITEAYGSDKGLELWEQITSVLDPEVKGQIFFAMITGQYNNRILLKGLEEEINVIWCIKAIRQYTGFGLKEAKDLVDRLRSPLGHTEHVTVKPEDYAHAFRELRKVGFILG